MNLSRNEGSGNSDLATTFIGAPFVRVFKLTLTYRSLKASGDLRNVVSTINGLPEDYSGHFTALLNDHNPTVVARNLFLLMMLSMIPDMDSAVELALHFWYTIMLPMEYNINLKIVIAVLSQFHQDDGTFDISLGKSSKLRAKLQPRVLGTMVSMMDSRYGLQAANAEIERVR